MRMIHPLLCTQCGAPLKNERECDYCGVRFSGGTIARPSLYTVADNGPELIRISTGVSAKAFEDNASTKLFEKLRRDIEIEKELFGRAFVPALQKIIEEAWR